MSTSRESGWKPPKLFDGYRVLWTIGRTEHSTLCMGQDTVLDRPVTVRFLDIVKEDADLRDRFLAEARQVSKVAHPNLLTIHRVGTIDDRPYIVSEYVRGQTLDQIPKPLPWRQVLSFALSLVRGLSAAHRRGVLHRGLRPASVLISSDGNVKLCEMGLREFCGEDISVPRAPAEAEPEQGSPQNSQPTLMLPMEATELRERLEHFLAPEISAKEPVTQRADLFALGVMLFELLTGKLPPKTVQTEPLSDDLPMDAGVSEMDPRFFRIVLRCMRARAIERFSSSDELLVALEQLVPRGGSDKIPDGNPYRGLLAFEAEHRSLFFGRRSEIGTLLERLRSDACVLVAAESGVGKSSVCRAGVLPLVQEGALGGGRSWQVLTMVPGRHPLTSLVQLLLPLCDMSESELAHHVSTEPDRLARMLYQSLGADRGLLLFVDQLEELSTLADPKEAECVSEALGSLLSRIPNVRLLVTARSDYLGKVASLPGIGEVVTRCLYILRPLGPDKIREAVVGPAHAKGVLFESAELVNGLVESTATTDGGLPLLQFALAELWEARQGNRITQAALDQIGGVTGALSRHADHIVGTLPPVQRQSARRVLMNLVTLEGTRARRNEEELIQKDPNAKVALETLVRGRLLVVRDTADGAAYEVAHEALIRGWGTLGKWLEENAESRAAKQRLEQAAAEWRRLGRTDEALWSPAQLVEITQIDPADVSEKEQEFVQASESQVRKKQVLRRLLFASVPLLIGLVYAAFEYAAHRKLAAKVQSYLADGTDALAKGRKRNGVVEKLKASAYQSFDAGGMADGEEQWSRALALSQEVEREYSRASQAFEAALTADSGHTQSRELLADALYERALIAERDRHPQQAEDLLQRLSLYDVAQVRKTAWMMPAELSIRSVPPAQIRLGRYERNAQNRRELTGVHELGRSPIATTSLAAGSYLLLVTAPGFDEMRFPVAVSRGEKLSLDLTLMPQGRVPAGFVYIPKGRFLFGTTADETMRKSMLSHVPIHPAQTDAFLMAKYETTFGDWLVFLSSLSPEERNKYLFKPQEAGSAGPVGVAQLPNGEYQLHLQPATKKFVVKVGAPFVYEARKKNREQDWTRFPATGMTVQDAKDYAAWLDKTGKVKGARLCTELEWERAAKGADDREWPHGDDLLPTDANFDATYSMEAPAMGPDPVGSYPPSQSPFGIFDLAGNAFEWTQSTLSKNEYVFHSGGFFYGPIVQRATNRSVMDPTTRNPGFGIRICASVPF